MANQSNVGDNPNDKLPDGNPLKPGEVVSDDDASSAAMEKEVEEDLGELEDSDRFDGLDNDLVNVGKFNDPAAEDDGFGAVDEEDDQPVLPD